LQLASAVTQATQKLGPEVAYLRHSIGSDTSGEPSIFFRIVLADEASEEATLADVTGKIVSILFDEIRPYENWGLTPYFSFRSKSELQATRDEPEWT
jgi:hypothetical protein